ncbi:MAG: hypothetical protein ACI8QY_000249, partial [bacterium]
MSSTIEGYGILNNGTSSHLYDRLNGKDVSASSATIVENTDGESVRVSISPEAKSTLEKIDALTEELRYIENQLGEMNFSATDKSRISEIAGELDKLHGYNLAQTSESYLFLGEITRPQADALFTELDQLLSADDILSEDQTPIDTIILELDNILTSGDKYASHSLQGLDNSKLKEVTNLFITLAATTKGIEDNNLSDRELQAASDISVQIDTVLNAHANLTPAKNMTTTDENNVNALLKELDGILEKNSSLGVSEKLRQMTQQTSLSFIQIINGKKSNIDDIFSSSNTRNSYSSSSK